MYNVFTLCTVFIAVRGPCFYFWIFSNDDIKVRKVNINNYRREDELGFFIRLLNKTALKEIGARGTFTIENAPLDSSTEEEVANGLIRVDVRHSQSSA